MEEELSFVPDDNDAEELFETAPADSSQIDGSLGLEASGDQLVDADSTRTAGISPQDIDTAIQDLLRQSLQTRDELAETRALIRSVVENNQSADGKLVDDDFIAQARERYGADPFQGAAMLVGKARDDLSRLMDHKIYEALGAREQFGKLMDDFLEDPSNNSLKGFRDELEFLIRDRGVEPKQAAGFLKAIESKTLKSAARKSEALKDVRTRSMTETGGRPIETRDPDRELTRAFRQARNLDEMFAALKRSRV